MRPSTPDRRSSFGRHEDWPFAIRHDLLVDLLAFLSPPKSSGPKLLSVVGPSGSGKSFLARELATRWSASSGNSLALYVDVPPAEYEAAAVEKTLAALLAHKRRANRHSPSLVPALVSQRWRKVQAGSHSQRASYFYRVSRDLIAQIPIVGPFISAVLPEGLPDFSHANGSRALRFILQESHTRPVLIVFDNIQHIPSLIRDMIEGEFDNAGPRLRVILVEQCEQGPEIEWLQSMKGVEIRSEALGPSTKEEVSRLIEAVMPEAFDRIELASAVQRRSGGNLKSAWFQLKMIAERRSSQLGTSSQDAYEQAIESLPPLDIEVLRFVVFLLGGFTVSQVAQLLQAAGQHVTADQVGSAVHDMTTLGLLIINSDRHDRVRVEHELVAQTVRALTPEEEKLELRLQLLAALSKMLETRGQQAELPALYDRLVGIADETDVRANPRLLTYLVQFIELNYRDERYTYLCGMFRDSVCWNVIELLPEHSVRLLLTAVQRCSLFEFGLLAVQRLSLRNAHRDLAALFEAKYLVQLFRYDEAAGTLSHVAASKEKRSIEFNIMLNLCRDTDAAEVAEQVLRQLPTAPPSEHDFLVLRNSGHLFKADKARQVLDASVEGFEGIGSRFGVASALNNRGIIDLVDEDLSAARTQFERSRAMLSELGSDEVYQALVNLGGVAFAERDWAAAVRLLQEARSSVPLSLSMDDVMLDFNLAAVGLAIVGGIGLPEVAQFQRLHARAGKTQDLRFIQIVGWFADNVQAIAAGGVEHTTRKWLEDRIGAKKRAGIELFQQLQIGASSLTIPYVLSPHWRY